MCASQEPLQVRHRYCAQPRLNAMCVTGWSFHRGAGLHAPLASGLTPHVVIVVEELPRDLHARGMREDRASIVEVPTPQTKFVADTSPTSAWRPAEFNPRADVAEPRTRKSCVGLIWMW